MDCSEWPVSATLFNKRILHDLIAVFGSLLLHKGHLKIFKPYLGRKTVVDILKSEVAIWQQQTELSCIKRKNQLDATYFII